MFLSVVGERRARLTAALKQAELAWSTRVYRGILVGPLHVVVVEVVAAAVAVVIAVPLGLSAAWLECLVVVAMPLA